jgi:hypothetical protein
LIDADGVPLLLPELALNKDKRKETLRRIITEKYPNITEKDLTTMSPGQLDTKLADKMYNVTGATRQKARTFLLKAAEYTGIQLSKLLTAKGPRESRKGSKKTPANGKTVVAAVVKKDSEAQPTGTQKTTIQLGSGGSLTLSLDVNILELKGKDRTFVFDLIDKIEDYEKPNNI